MPARPHVVIVGAGFGGLWATKGLAKADVDVTLVDRNNYHSFFPLLYQVAAAELQPSDIAYPIRTIVRNQRNTTFRLGTVSSIDLDSRTVVLEDGQLVYDYLVLAPGSHTRHFGVEGAAEHSFGLRTLDDALALRNLRHRRRRTDRGRVRRSAPGVPQRSVRQRLRQRPGHAGPGGVGRGRRPAAHDVSGAPEPLRRQEAWPHGGRCTVGSVCRGGDPGRLHNRNGDDPVCGSRVDGRRRRGPQLPNLGVPRRSGGEDRGRPQSHRGRPSRGLRDRRHRLQRRSAHAHGRPKRSPAGRHAAAAIRRPGAEPEPFVYKDLGSMAVIGRNSAVVHLWNRIPLTGCIAWIMWLAVHLAKLIGFRNRLAALISWTGDYFFSDRVARLIIPGDAAKGAD